jgi:hypothetical protein
MRPQLLELVDSSYRGHAAKFSSPVISPGQTYIPQIASLGLAVAFYYGITAYACVWYFRRSLTSSSRNLFMRGVFPLLGALAMTWAFVQSAADMIKPDYGYTAYGSIGGVFVVGVGMLALGVPLMLLCFAYGTKRFFRGETLNAQTEVKVPDVY